ncbi:Xylose isomerase domain-containing protein TIM barrel [Emticicia oligotrophica DSM 17448]|uniref:Xylose isomerase domain-containing protein TIM barrel n=1 Tax=Emticicia oligotrophica (strain DSM 17448 / CIP 109782 / MTCC 6937 / GPTSA100-15) TaxID=929562 RepID=A0ABM5N211_EMTOG|nr:sugar phosphate isomerase/epimerase [Emticicia oligotrophica]AFK03473.1 Xylose isomerase domain-containing protein TIM barrel [Emticicia oligotrophica DSM 17448]
MKTKIITLFSLLGVFTTKAQNWQHISSEDGTLPLSWKNTQQTASLAFDIDKDGIDEFVVCGRGQGTSIIYFKFDRAIGWREFAIDKEQIPLEASGTTYDIDQDGDLDLIFGGDTQSNKIWWWENPAPFYNPNVPWHRFELKTEGENQNTDLVFGDFKQIGKAQLAFWSQGGKQLVIATAPEEVTGKWSFETIYTSTQNNSGSAVADVDGDGNKDLVAGNMWFKYVDGKFKPTKVTEVTGRVVAAKFKVGKKMQLLYAPGSKNGALMLYECNGSAEVSSNWKGKDLIGRELTHAQTLEVVDYNDDGNLDIFCAEMVKWDEKSENLNAEAFILLGDGKGNFTKTIFQKGVDFHEARMSDIDGDGDFDILSKSYLWKNPRIEMWLQNGTGERIPNIGKILGDRIGLELYSLRDYFKTDIVGTLAYVKSLGITDVEVAGTYGMKTEAFKAELDKVGLKPYSTLLDYNLFRDSLSKVVATCKALGIKYAGCAWIPHISNKFGKEDADKAIKVFNKAGEALAKEGIKFYYHCHGYEFKPTEDGTLFDYIVKQTNPENVSFECDVYWAFHGGQDPALLLKKHKGRFLALHLKDMKYGQETGELSGGTPLTSDVAIGTGQLDFRKILRAAIQTGVKFYYIEDENEVVKEHLPVSLRYLKNLK